MLQVLHAAQPDVILIQEVLDRGNAHHAGCVERCHPVAILVPQVQVARMIAPALANDVANRIGSNADHDRSGRIANFEAALHDNGLDKRLVHRDIARDGVEHLAKSN